MFNTIGIITKPNDPRSDDKARELAIFLKDKNVAVVKDDKQISVYKFKNIYFPAKGK
jgi:NAD kinase